MFNISNTNVVIASLLIALPLLIGTLVNFMAGCSLKIVERVVMASILIATWFAWPVGGFFLLVAVISNMLKELLAQHTEGQVSWPLVIVGGFKF